VIGDGVLVELGEAATERFGSPWSLVQPQRSQIRAAFCEAVSKDRQGGATEVRQEFDRMLTGAAKIVAGTPTRQSERGCFCGHVPDRGMSDAHLTDVVTMDVLRGRWLWSGALNWLRWDGRRWEQAPTPVLQDEVRLYLLSRYEEARRTAHELAARIDELAAHRGLAKDNGNGSSAASSHEIEELKQRQTHAEQEAKHWHATLSRARIAAISDLVRGVVACDAAKFDSRPEPRTP
jgi:hypothetical protein